MSTSPFQGGSGTKPEPETVLSFKKVLKHRQTLFAEEPPEPKTGTARTVPSLAHQNRTIAIASDFRVDGAKSPEIPQKEGGLGLRNRSPKSQIASDFPSRPQIAMQHCFLLSRLRCYFSLGSSSRPDPTKRQRDGLTDERDAREAQEGGVKITRRQRQGTGSTRNLLHKFMPS